MPHHSHRRALATVAVSGLLAALTVAAPVSAASGSFTNPSPITITPQGSNVSAGNDTDIVLGELAGPGSTYPSTIDLEAPAGAAVQEISVQVSINHERMDDVDLMLVGPGGQSTMLLSDGGGDGASNGGLYFYPWGTAYPDENGNPYYIHPTDWDTTPGDTDAFPAPAPASARDDFEDMYGKPVTGAWSLYAVDDTDGSVGTIRDWSLNVYYAMPAAPSPSTLAVAGLPNSVTDVNLSLNDINLNSLNDTEFVLESPDGRRAHVLSDAGGNGSSLSFMAREQGLTADTTITLDDEAAEPMRRNTEPTTGSYQPVNYDVGDTTEFVGGFDTTNLSSSLSTFDGANPNGTWKLYVSQEYCCNEGAISGGWSLDITTADSTATPVITSPTNGSHDPDGTVTVTGTATAGSLIQVTVDDKTRNTVADGGTWTVTFGDLANGSRTFTAIATDASGNVSAPATVTVVVDKAPPVAVVVESEDADTVAPKVRKIKPGKQATGVDTSASARVRFSEAMIGSSVKDSVKLVSVETGKSVDAELVYRDAKNLLVINPDKALAHHTTYKIVVKQHAKDLAGNLLKKSRKSTFTTR